MVRKFLAIGVLCLASLAFVPGVMASTDFVLCSPEFNPPDIIHYSADKAEVVALCADEQLVAMQAIELSPSFDSDKPAECMITTGHDIAADTRIFDPGRCLVPT